MAFDYGDFLEGFFASSLIGDDNNNQETPDLSNSVVDGNVSSVVKNPELDLSEIPDYEDSAVNFNFRPQTLDEFIGQEKAKELIKIGVKRFKVLNEHIHIFLSGSKGHGKTTLAKIISNMLGGQFFYRTGAQLENIEELSNLLKQMYYSKEYPVLFLDEIHTLKPEIIEKYFYTLMEDFKIGNKSIRPFTLICATTEEDMLAKRLPPFMDRFNLHINLEDYTEEDIYQIIKQYQEKFLPWREGEIDKFINESSKFIESNEKIKAQMQKEENSLVFEIIKTKGFWRNSEIVKLVIQIGKAKRKELFYFNEEELEELWKSEIGKRLKKLVNEEMTEDLSLKPLKKDDLTIISKNARLTPRIAINLLKNSLVAGIETTLQANGIIKDGLTDVDFKILKTLKEIGKPVGEEALALSVGLTRSKYRTMVEPFLISEGYIMRTRVGRIITEKGKELLEELEK